MAGFCCSSRRLYHSQVLALDFVQPSVAGTRWGLGGTCVNVGCVPKKLMHYASLLGHSFEHAQQFGWRNIGGAAHDWPTMSTLVTDYIKSLNFIYRNGLRSARVRYEEGYASLVDAHTIEARWNSEQMGQSLRAFIRGQLAYKNKIMSRAHSNM
jgi:pyruvate/2-oxoglutarate dehydrogenase complex dihydrolipoamide dehydrogenase (E3) component